MFKIDILRFVKYNICLGPFLKVAFHMYRIRYRSTKKNSFLLSLDSTHKMRRLERPLIKEALFVERKKKQSLMLHVCIPKQKKRPSLGLHFL